MPSYTTKVDHGALRANQILIITLNLAAFVFNFWPIAAVVALVMGAGSAIGKPGFLPIYRFLLKPLRLVRPEILEDDPRSHRFAQGFGSVVMVAGTIAPVQGARGGMGCGLARHPARGGQRLRGLLRRLLRLLPTGSARYPRFYWRASCGNLPGVRPKE
jgi:hypothetical protein